MGALAAASLLYRRDQVKGLPWLVIRWLTRCRMYINASVSANMKMSGQKLLYKMLMVSFRRPKAVKGYVPAEPQPLLVSHCSQVRKRTQSKFHVCPGHP